MVKSGGNKKGFLKSDHKLAKEEIGALKKAWRNLYANNTENVVVLNKGLDFQEASNSSVEMQLNETVKTLQEQIKDLFHISDDFNLTFKLAIYPVVKAFETALNRDLLLEKEKGKYFFDFELFPTKSKRKGKTVYYCPDCAVDRVEWRDECGHPYELVDLDDDMCLCPNCMEVLSAKNN